MRVEELEGKLRQASESVAESGDAMRKIVLLVEGRAKRLAPVRTGTLNRANRGVVETPRRGKLANSVEYARYVHDGTSFMQARPFGREAIEESRGEIEQILREHGVTVLGRVGR